jgi:hypothetical protein
MDVLLEVKKLVYPEMDRIELKLHSNRVYDPQGTKEDEIAPLVSVYNYRDELGVGHLRGRIFVFTTNICEPPTIGVTNDNTCFYIQTEIPDENKNKTPEYYRLWYFDLKIPTGYMVYQICVFNILADPKTSRGTVTTVQSTTPPPPPMS